MVLSTSLNIGRTPHPAAATSTSKNKTKSHRCQRLAAKLSGHIYFFRNITPSTYAQHETQRFPTVALITWETSKWVVTNQSNNPHHQITRKTNEHRAKINRQHRVPRVVNNRFPRVHTISKGGGRREIIL